MLCWMSRWSCVLASLSVPSKCASHSLALSKVHLSCVYVLLLRNCTFQSGDFILAKLPGACFIFDGVLRLVVTFQITLFIHRNSSITYETCRLTAKLNEQELFRPTIIKHATFAVNFPFLAWHDQNSNGSRSACWLNCSFLVQTTVARSQKNIYASYSTLGGATYFNAVRSSIKIIQGLESGAQAVQSSDGTKIQNKEILFCTFI